MPVGRFLQASLASGEFDPLLAAREDVGFYYTSAKLIENAIVLPQGGAKRREGLRFAGYARGIPSLFDISGYTYAAPNGGAAANAQSATSAFTLLTTGAIGTATEYVALSWDAASDRRVSFVDMVARKVGGAGTTLTVAVQGSADNITWDTGFSLTIGETFYTRRFATIPDQDIGTRRYWRIVVLNPTAFDYTTAEIEIYGLKVWSELGYSAGVEDVGNVKLRKISAAADAEYFAAITESNVDIYSDTGTWLAAVPIPHLDADVSEIKTSQQRDTLVLYHEDFPAHIVQRLDGSDTQWRADLFPFTTITDFAYEDGTVVGENEIQEINFNSMTAGDRLIFEYNGDISAEVVWSATPATNVTNFTTAIEALRDITSVTITSLGGDNYEIEFDGVDAEKFFATVVVDLLTGSGTVTNTRKQAGGPGKEDLWSATRGYARCGTFYQGRHWMGGFRSRPDLIVSSRAGNFADFRTDNDPVATSPLVLAPDIDEQVTVENIYAGRNLQIFTSSAEIYIPDEPITPENVALKVTSKRGMSSLTQPIDVQGGTMFVDRNGTALREYLFLDTQASYTAEPISTLGGHLIQNPIELALRRSVATNEPTIAYVINQGRDRNFDTVPPAAITIDRAQQITAFARITSGAGAVFGSVAATQGGKTAFSVQRDLAGARWKFIEVLDETQMGDHSEEVANDDVIEIGSTGSGATTFSYAAFFTSPTDPADIGVFRRFGGQDLRRRVDPSLYTLDLGTREIVLTEPQQLGEFITIAKRQTSFTTTLDTLNGIECYVHADGRPVGAHTPTANAVTIAGDEGFFFTARIGLRMVPKITLQAYKGQGGQSPTMQKQRIFRALVNVERTANVALGVEGRAARPIPLTNFDAGFYDADLEDVLFTGTKRVSGVGSWQTEPRIEITQTEPAPWSLRSITYDIRF